MIILGIDPALSRLGWGIISSDALKLHYVASGLITTKSTELMHKRLAFINARLEEIILLYKPEAIAMEETFVNMNNASSLKLGYARGAIMSLIGRYDAKFYEFKPNVIKKSVVGYGHAEKKQILHMIKLLFPASSSITSLDEADAVAIAYTCSLYSKCEFRTRGV